MFYLSKAVWAVVQPSTLIALLLLAGLGLASTRHKRSGKRVAVAASLFYLVCGFSPLGDWLIASLENRPARPPDDALARASAIVVLGGGISPARKGAEPRLNDAGERMVEVLRLARRFPSMPIVFSGGKSAFLNDDDVETEAATAKRFLAVFDIAPPRLKLEDRSRNTFENAFYTARLLEPTSEQSFILVTSAFHMLRACLLFERQGMRVLARPADFRTSAATSFPRFFLRAGDGFDRVDGAAKEWVAIFVYWLLGDIANPLAACGAARP